MTDETSIEFNDRRAIDEKALADAAADSVEAIPHRQLSKLHADEARTLGGEAAPQKTALSIAAVGDNVTIETISGELILLTPEAAALTSDRLLARSRDATRSRQSK